MEKIQEKSLRRTAKATAVAAGVVIGLSLTAASSTAQEDRGDTSSEVRTCISLRQIDHTSVIDDDTILFYGRGREIFRNDLPNHCPELRTEQRFMYRVALSQLCSSDTITVLNDIGFGFTPGATCGLGKFAPITSEEADQLESRSRDRDGPRRERNRDRSSDQD
jgi:hypothetical protein